MENGQSSPVSRNNIIMNIVFSIFMPLILLGFIIWHTIMWHTNGTHNEMLSWTGTDKSYLVVLYNLGLVLITGTMLGLLMSKITELVSLAIHRWNKFDKGS